MKAWLFILAALALALTQVLEGGYELSLCLPGYGILALAALCSWWPSRRATIPREAADSLAAGGLFFAYVAGRALFSPEEYLARTDLYMALGAMVLYLLVALNLTPSKWRGLFVAFLLLLAITNCVIGALQFAKGRDFMVLDFLPRSNYGPRSSGLYGYPNHLALFLETGLFMGLGLAFWSRWRPWIKILAGYGAFVCVAGILMTGSRGGYIGAAAGLAVFGLLSLRLAGEFARGRAFILIVAAGLLIVLMGWGVRQFLSSSSVLQARLEQSVKTGEVRPTLWKVAWQQFKHHPVAGTGSGTFLYYGRQLRPAILQNDPVHAHNEYLELLAEYGVLGIAAALMFLDAHLRTGWKYFRQQASRQSDGLSVGGNSLALTVGALSAVVACAAHSAVDFTLHMPANMLTMAFILGVLANPGGNADAPSQSSEGNLSAYLRLALPALGLWIALRALPTLPAEYFDRKAHAVISDSQYMASEEVARSLEDTARRGLAWDPRNPKLHLYAGMAETAMATQATDPAAQKEWSARAIASYEKAVQLAPSDNRFVLSLVWSLDASQRFAESEPLLKHALELEPNSGDVHYAYASHLHAQGKLAEAAVEYQRAIELHLGQSAQMGLDSVKEEMKAGVPAPR